jgi:hypothetical protein
VTRGKSNSPGGRPTRKKALNLPAAFSSTRVRLPDAGVVERRDDTMRGAGAFVLTFPSHPTRTKRLATGLPSEEALCVRRLKKYWENCHFTRGSGNSLLMQR